MSVPGLAPATGVRPWRHQLKQATSVVVAAAVPFLGFVAFNKLMGQGLLPNSGRRRARASPGRRRTPSSRGRSQPPITDPSSRRWRSWWRERSWWVSASSGLHLPAIASSSPAAPRDLRRSAGTSATRPSSSVGVIVLLAIARGGGTRAPTRPCRCRCSSPRLILGGHQDRLDDEVPTAVQDTYQQRYQAGRFLGRYYDGEPVATGELGYISLDHDGPITDSSGSATTRCSRPSDGRCRSRARRLEPVAKDRGVKVAAVYPSTLLYDTPEVLDPRRTWHMGQAGDGARTRLPVLGDAPTEATAEERTSASSRRRSPRGRR